VKEVAGTKNVYVFALSDYSQKLDLNKE